MSSSYAPFQTRFSKAASPQEALSSRQPTFDLGDEVASGRECLYCAQQRVPRNHLAHHTKRFSQAFVGQWPSGLQQVCGTEQK